MNKASILILKLFRRLYTKLVSRKPPPPCEQDPALASQIIFNELVSDRPTLIARFGSTEMMCIRNYLGVMNKNKSKLQFIKGQSSPWWWEKSMIEQMQQWSGFFPPEISKLETFCQLMLEDLKAVNILGSWLPSETIFENQMNSQKIQLRFLEPFWSKNPWTMSLKNKNILVVHPFSNTIEQQYLKRKLLFMNKNILPDFKSLTVLKAVQTLGGSDDRFEDWFEALNYMKGEIDKIDYDICLIGAGAYGFPLAAHVKRMGKKGIHIGGALQLLFGIKGKRWEDPNYGVKEWGIPYGSYTNLINEHWVRPNELV
jgi:hypothetical protein